MAQRFSLFKVSLAAGACFAGLGVILGALGAHALADSLEEGGMLAAWETAVAYQMWHALALILLALLIGGGWLGKRSGVVVFGCFFFGTVAFSGSIYLLSLEGPRWLGPITPLGGLLFILGWAVLGVTAMRNGDRKARLKK